MPIFTDSFWSIADNDLCNYFSVSPPVVKLSYYHAFSYVDGPLADADIRAFSTRTFSRAESNRAVPICFHKYQFHHVKLSPAGPSPEWSKSFSAPLPTVTPLFPLKRACVVILRVVSVQEAIEKDVFKKYFCVELSVIL